MVVQTEFPEETGVPRWGCLWLLDSAAVCMFADLWPQHPTLKEALAIYEMSLGSMALVKEANESKDPNELTVMDPTRSIGHAIRYYSLPMWGRQYPDLYTTHPSLQTSGRETPDVPWNHNLAFVKVAFKRPRGLHWVLCDKRGGAILYDPSPDLSPPLDPWLRDGAWRGVQLWRA